MVTKRDGQDDDDEWGVETISDPGQGDGGALEALGIPVTATRGTK